MDSLLSENGELLQSDRENNVQLRVLSLLERSDTANIRERRQNNDSLIIIMTVIIIIPIIIIIKIIIHNNSTLSTNTKNDIIIIIIIIIIMPEQTNQQTTNVLCHSHCSRLFSLGFFLTQLKEIELQRSLYNIWSVCSYREF